MRANDQQKLEKASGSTSLSQGVQLLVVIDHREARIFRTEVRGSVPQRIVAYNPEGPNRHLHRVDNESNGQRKPEPKAYYEGIARALGDADAILIFGSGTGSSSAMDHLMAELKMHHARAADRIVGAVVVNEQHMTEGQLLAQARAFYAAANADGAPKDAASTDAANKATDDRTEAANKKADDLARAANKVADDRARAANQEKDDQARAKNLAADEAARAAHRDGRIENH